MAVTICLAGCGRAGMIHGMNLASRVEGARVVALVDTHTPTLDECGSNLGVDARFPSFEKALDKMKFDAVVVAAPSALHRDIVVAAARAGKHILCEKPMAMNESECDDMIKAVEKAGVILQLGFMRRYDANFLAAWESVQRGDIGDVVLVKSLTRGPSIPKPWMYDISVSNGPLSEVNSHDIDTLRWFAGSEFAEVYAIAGNYRCPDAKKDFPDFYDNVLMTVRFANGTQGCIDGAQAVLYGYDSRTEILGTKGLVTVGRLSENSVMTYSSEGKAGHSIVKSWRTLFEEAYLAEDRAFIDCVIHNKKPAVSGHDGKMAVAAVNAGNLSIQRKQPIQLNTKDTRA
jgi:predicted dehydrogenase